MDTSSRMQPGLQPSDFEKLGNSGLPYFEGLQDPESCKHGLNSLLANGRLAVVVIMGMMFQNGTFGTTGPDMWLLGGASEKETGEQAPARFFDPSGFCKDGDADAFYWRRFTKL